MCKYYWNADACRQCGSVSNLVSPGKADPRTGQLNTTGFMCKQAQRRDMERNRFTQHLDTPVKASNIARFKMRQLCRYHTPVFDSDTIDNNDKKVMGCTMEDDTELIYMWDFCTPECRQQHKAYMCKWSSPLSFCIGADEIEPEEEDAEGQITRPTSRQPLVPWQRPLASPMRKKVLKRNFQVVVRKYAYADDE
ncbi:hypothetical protein E8E14_005101 [Neopestalotiopsis sp. 37M]|nr:hypothetical protein E8E14_005101 [Neopestalotiopsis sp. 37M]